MVELPDYSTGGRGSDSHGACSVRKCKPMGQFDITYVHAVLTPGPFGSFWNSWCPELDVCSLGENPEHALGMLIDAIRLASEDDLSASRWDESDCGEPVKTRKSVRHPLRRGSRANEDEHWPRFEAFRSMTGDWNRSTDVLVSKLDSSMDFSVAHGHISIHSHGGIIHCNVHFSDYAIVPACNLNVKVRVIKEIDLIVSVPLATLAGDSAQSDVESIVLTESQRRLGHTTDMGDSASVEIVSIAARPYHKFP